MIENISKENKIFIEETYEKLKAKLDVVTVKSRDKIPYSVDANGEHDDFIVPENLIWMWTNGFWAGLNWLMYDYTKNEDYMLTAKKSEEYLSGMFDDLFKLYHDVGFLWHISAGANYRLTGDEKSLQREYLAAMSLASRYNVNGDFIRAWNDKHAAGYSIIDCMMNLPLLYFIDTKIATDNRFKYIAMRHADMSIRDHVREDGSIYHIVEHSIHEKKVLSYPQGQGYSPESAWSRGQAWGLYGFVLSYIHTNKDEYLETAKKVSKYFIEKVKETNYLPLSDFDAPKTPIYYDSTAGAIAACGLIELYKITKDSYYLDNAISILKAMVETWCDFSLDKDYILPMGRERYHSQDHKYLIYGDMFFVEAILKLKGSEFLIW